MTQSEADQQRGVFPAMLTDTWADATTQPFWDAARRDQLAVQQCRGCGTFRLPPASHCWKCRSKDAEWVELPGTGTVYASTVVHHPLHRDLASVVPYVSAIVELDGTQGEGARLLLNVVECLPEDVTIGTRVEVFFDHVTDEMPVARARPIRV